MLVAAVGRAFPPHYYDQDTLLAALRAHWSRRHHNLDRLERIHRNVMVGGRHLALPLEDYPRLETFGQANDAWIRVGLEVGEAAVRDAVQRAGLPWDRVGAFLSTTVTGVATPSLDARLMNRLPLPRAVRRVPMFGLGCLAGAAGVARAADFVRAYPDRAALLLSVELCSLTLQRDDLSIPNIISSGLFGDGAACAVVLGDDLARELGAAGPRVVATRSVFYPDSERVMGWDVSERGFRIVLSAGVPEVVRRHLAGDVDALLSEHGLARDDVDEWIAHPGGPRVLEALDRTWRSLREVGNLSSTSVLLVLRDTLDDGPPAGSTGVMMALGPAFSSELVLLRWPG